MPEGTSLVSIDTSRKKLFSLPPGFGVSHGLYPLLSMRNVPGVSDLDVLDLVLPLYLELIVIVPRVERIL
jgi:hypothetical protein